MGGWMMKIRSTVGGVGKASKQLYKHKGSNLFHKFPQVQAYYTESHTAALRNRKSL